jgi:Tol biopolymer transport system component
MNLAPGTRLGPYKIIAPLGSGGMGEVYRAHDSRLGRDVAIKVLAPHLAATPEVRARFEREARTVSQLNHPHICTLHDVGHQDGTDYLVMELLEGETLAHRLEKGALPVAEVLSLGTQIADALDRAHRAGVVHRDLKPGNVMLTKAGAKLMDFGLARAAGLAAAAPGALTESPTVSRPLTAQGTIVGTFQYMAPEQLEGKEADARTDLFALGCVLYEMATGKRAFEGASQASLIAAILKEEPRSMTELRPLTPPALERIVKRCLEKDPEERFQSARDLAFNLGAVSGSTVGMPLAASGAEGRARSPLRRIAFSTGLVLAGAAVALGAWSALHRLPPRSPVRFEISETDGMSFTAVEGNVGEAAEIALSPDGKLLVFVAGDSSRSQLWVRPLESVNARPLAGTDEALLPFWSPDSRSIGFFTGTKLKRVPASGGDVQELCDVKRARGGTWNRQDVILYAPRSEGPLYRVSAAGGDPQQVTTLDSARHESGHRFPCFLPDGRHFVYSSLPAKDGKFDIMIAALDAPKPRRLMSAYTGVAYAEPGYLLSERNATVVAQPFDAAGGRLAGSPVTLRENALAPNMAGSPGVSASTTGTIAYRTLKLPKLRLAWMDLEGRETQRVAVQAGPYSELQLSPNDRRAAVTVLTADNNQGVWMCDLERGILTRLPQESEWSYTPKWSHDGKRIAYLTSRGPSRQSIAIRPVDESGTAETFLASDPLFKELYAWTPDDRALLYGRQDPTTRMDLWVLPLEGDRTPHPYLATPYSEQGATVSADGRWLLYTSDESGRPEAYVQSFPNAGSKYQITRDGALAAYWMPGKRQILIVPASAPSMIQIADVLPGLEFRAGPLRRFCAVPTDAQGADLAHDGKRLLVLLPSGKAPVSTITVVMNWREAAKNR